MFLVRFEGIVMRKSDKACALCLLAGSIFSPVMAFADPPADTPESVLEAGELIIDETYFLSEFREDRSYFVASVRPDDSVCTLRKTHTEYSPEDDEEQTIVTSYDIARIDMDRIASDGEGGITITALDEEPVFKVETGNDDAAATYISADTIMAKDDETDIDQLIEAVRTLIIFCAAES